jgi:O-antigen/teichoic acid export membrane protein
MPENKSLIKGILKFGSSSLSKLFLFLLLLLAARYLGAEEFGIFSFAIAFVYLFDPVYDPGLYHALIREIARNKELTQKYLSHALTWKLIVTPLFILMIYVSVNVIQKSQTAIYAVYLMAISFLLKSLIDAFRSALLAHELFGLHAICITIERLLLFLVGSLILLRGDGLLPFCFAFIIVRLVSFLIVVAITRYHVCSIRLGKDFGFLKKLVYTAVPIGALYITLNIYNYIDTVMLSAFKTDVEVGWYNASYKIYEGLLIFPVIIGTVLMPRLSQLYKSHKESFAPIFLKGIKYVIIISVIISFNGILLSDQIVSLCFGAEYKSSTLSLNVLLMGMIFVFSINFLQTAMITMDKQKIVLYLAICGLILNVLVNLYLIPKYSYVGAAFATVFVEGIVFICLLFYAQRIGIKIMWWQLIGKPITASLLAILIFWIIIPIRFISVQIFFVNVCFIAILFLMRVFDKEEVALFSNLRYSLKMHG